VKERKKKNPDPKEGGGEKTKAGKWRRGKSGLELMSSGGGRRVIYSCGEGGRDKGRWEKRDPDCRIRE